MGKYRQSKFEFFHSSVDGQKTPDMVVDLKRVGEDKIKEWSTEEMQHLEEWLQTVERAFAAYRSEISKTFKNLNHGKQRGSKRVGRATDTTNNRNT